MGNRRRADKADGLDIRIIKDRINRFLVAVDDVQNACRKAGLNEQFGNAHRHARITLGRLQHIGVAASQRRADFPQGDHGREVERGDARDNAERLAQRIDVDVRTCAISEFALEQVRRADAEFDHFKAALNVALGVGNGLAMLAGQKLSQRVIFGMNQFEEFHQNAGAALRVGGGPFGMRGLGVFDGRAHFGLRGQRNAAQNRAVHRLEIFGRAAGCAGNMLAANEMSNFLHESSSKFDGSIMRYKKCIAMRGIAHLLCEN